jgi:hypothetical protein
MLAIADSQPIPTWALFSTLEFAMNIELDEVVVQNVSDDALELAAGGAPTKFTFPCYNQCSA